MNLEASHARVPCDTGSDVLAKRILKTDQMHVTEAKHERNWP